MLRAVDGCVIRGAIVGRSVESGSGVWGAFGVVTAGKRVLKYTPSPPGRELVVLAGCGFEDRVL